MKKLVVVLLAASLAILALTGVAAAGTTVKAIEFDLEGEYVSYEPVTGIETSVPASAFLTGNIRDKGGTRYLSPLTGTITIDSMDHGILVKAAKQSEPIYYWEWEEGTPGEWYVKGAEWLGGVEVNIEGDKYIGLLSWGWIYVEDYGDVWEHEDSELECRGIVRGKMVEFFLSGGLPTIE